MRIFGVIPFSKLQMALINSVMFNLLCVSILFFWMLTFRFSSLFQIYLFFNFYSFFFFFKHVSWHIGVARTASGVGHGGPVLWRCPGNRIEWGCGKILCHLMVLSAVKSHWLSLMQKDCKLKIKTNWAHCKLKHWRFLSFISCTF